MDPASVGPGPSRSLPPGVAAPSAAVVPSHAPAALTAVQAALTDRILQQIAGNGGSVSGRVVASLGTGTWLLNIRGSMLIAASDLPLQPDSVVMVRPGTTGADGTPHLRLHSADAMPDPPPASSADPMEAPLGDRLRQLGLPDTAAVRLAFTAFTDAGAPLDRDRLLRAAAAQATIMAQAETPTSAAPGADPRPQPAAGSPRTPAPAPGVASSTPTAPARPGDSVVALPMSSTLPALLTAHALLARADLPVNAALLALAVRAAAGGLPNLAAAVQQIARSAPPVPARPAGSPDPEAAAAPARPDAPVAGDRTPVPDRLARDAPPASRIGAPPHPPPPPLAPVVAASQPSPAPVAPGSSARGRLEGNPAAIRSAASAFPPGSATPARPIPQAAALDAKAGTPAATPAGPAQPPLRTPATVEPPATVNAAPGPLPIAVTTEAPSTTPRPGPAQPLAQPTGADPAPRPEVAAQGGRNLSASLARTDPVPSSGRTTTESESAAKATTVPGNSGKYAVSAEIAAGAPKVADRAAAAEGSVRPVVPLTPTADPAAVGPPARQRPDSAPIPASGDPISLAHDAGRPSAVRQIRAEAADAPLAREPAAGVPAPARGIAKAPTQPFPLGVSSMAPGHVPVTSLALTPGTPGAVARTSEAAPPHVHPARGASTPPTAQRPMPDPPATPILPGGGSVRMPPPTDPVNPIRPPSAAPSRDPDQPGAVDAGRDDPPAAASARPAGIPPAREQPAGPMPIRNSATDRTIPPSLQTSPMPPTLPASPGRTAPAGAVPAVPLATPAAPANPLRPAIEAESTPLVHRDPAIVLRQVLDGLAHLPDPQRDGAPAVLRAFALAGLPGVPATMAGAPTALAPMSVVHQLVSLFQAIPERPSSGAPTSSLADPDNPGASIAPDPARTMPKALAPESIRPELPTSTDGRQNHAEPAPAEPGKSEPPRAGAPADLRPTRPEPGAPETPRPAPEAPIERRSSADPDLSQATLRAVRETVAETMFKPRELADYDIVLPLPAAPGGQPMPGRIALASRGTSGGGRSVWMRIDTELSHLGKVSVRLSGSDAGAVAITVVAERRAAAAFEAAAPGMNTSLRDLGLAAGLRIAVEDAPW